MFWNQISVYDIYEDEINHPKIVQFFVRCKLQHVNTYGTLAPSIKVIDIHPNLLRPRAADLQLSPNACNSNHNTFD